MAYSEVGDIQDILVGQVGQPGEYDITPAMLSDAQIEYAISDADAQIDLVVRKLGYETPLPSPVPAIVHTLSCDIAAYLAWMTWKGEQSMDAAHPIRLRYDRANSLLKQVQMGLAELYDYADLNAPPRSTAGAILINDYPVFTPKDVFPRRTPWAATHDAEFGETIYIENIPRHGQM